MELRMSEQQVKMARSGSMPTIALIAKDELSGPYTSDLIPVDANVNVWFVGVGLQYDLGSLWHNYRAIRKAKTEREAVCAAVRLAEKNGFVPFDPSAALKAGDKVTLGYVTLANFNNPTGLEKIGDNLYAVSANSGEPTFEMPGSGNAGQLSPSNLEMSNVDLSEEIVNMIITQRGFQANSRIITTTDTMLEELVNLKR